MCVYVCVCVCVCEFVSVQKTEWMDENNNEEFETCWTVVELLQAIRVCICTHTHTHTHTHTQTLFTLQPGVNLIADVLRATEQPRNRQERQLVVHVVGNGGNRSLEDGQRNVTAQEAVSLFYKQKKKRNGK